MFRNQLVEPLKQFLADLLLACSYSASCVVQDSLTIRLITYDRDMTSETNDAINRLSFNDIKREIESQDVKK